MVSDNLDDVISSVSVCLYMSERQEVGRERERDERRGGGGCIHCMLMVSGHCG